MTIQVPRNRRPALVSVNSVFSFSTESRALWLALRNALPFFSDCRHALTTRKVGSVRVADVIS